MKPKKNELDFEIIEHLQLWMDDTILFNSRDHVSEGWSIDNSVICNSSGEFIRDYWVMNDNGYEVVIIEDLICCPICYEFCRDTGMDIETALAISMKVCDCQFIVI